MNFAVFLLRFFAVAVLFLMYQGCVNAELKYSQKDFPPLYTFDDYDLCLKNRSTQLPPTYCMIYAEVQPDNSSELWQAILEHNNYRYNYHYDRLFFGVCLKRCLNVVGHIAENITYPPENFTIDNEITEYFEYVQRRPLDIEIRTKYASVIHNCLNAEFEQKYNLKLKTFIEYCESPSVETAVQETDLAESILKKFFKTLLLLVALSTFYDYFLKTRQTDENLRKDFYKNNLHFPLSRIFTSFSLTRNYYRLTQPYRGDLGQDFSYIDGLRSMGTLIVVNAHTFYLEFMHVKNPEFFEANGQSTAGLMTLNTSTVIEIFMVISGLLLNVKFTTGRFVTPHTNWMKCAQVFVFIVLSRLMRFLPSVGMLVWVNVTVLKNWGNGPFWRHLTEPGRIFGREGWWKNLFMLNNFSMKDTVSAHTWYLAADFQLFVLYTLVLILISKYPQFKKSVYGILAVLAILIPTMVCYLMKLDASFVVRPEVYRYGFMKDADTFYYLYTPFYNSLGGYLVGMLCGEFYLLYSQNAELREKCQRILKYEIFAWLLVPLTMAGISYVGSITNFMQPSIWTALFAGLNRNIWNIIVCGIPVVVMACKRGKIIYDFCRLPMFRIFARLSFQMYLFDVLILQLTNGHQRRPHHLSDLYFNGQALISISLLIIVAFFACLLIEYPFAQLFNALQIGRKRTGKEQPPNK
uniref:Acyltransferase 3 domain-containing protein n=1 Tax=Musca domestica TaxID=7370 RepID=A0A1I8MG92_MUSDO